MEITHRSLRSRLTITNESYRADDEKKMTLRLPPLLHAALVKIANKDRRSLHAEIITLLEEAARKRGEYDGDDQP